MDPTSGPLPARCCPGKRPCRHAAWHPPAMRLRGCVPRRARAWWSCFSATPDPHGAPRPLAARVCTMGSARRAWAWWLCFSATPDPRLGAPRPSAARVCTVCRRPPEVPPPCRVPAGGRGLGGEGAVVVLQCYTASLKGTGKAWSLRDPKRWSCFSATPLCGAGSCFSATRPQPHGHKPHGRSASLSSEPAGPARVGRGCEGAPGLRCEGSDLGRVTAGVYRPKERHRPWSAKLTS